MNLLLKGLIRGAIPFVFLLITSILNRLQGSFEESSVFFVYGEIAFFLGLTSVIYEINHWNFSKQIITHYGVMLITIFPTLLLSGFYPLNSFSDLVKVYIQFNMAGIVLFLSTYVIIKLIRKFNNVKA